MPAIGSSSSSCGSAASAGQVDALLQAVGQAADRRLAVGLDLEEVDPLDEIRARAVPRPRGRPQVQRLREDAGLHASGCARS